MGVLSDPPEAKGHCQPLESPHIPLGGALTPPSPTPLCSPEALLVPPACAPRPTMHHPLKPPATRAQPIKHLHPAMAACPTTAFLRPLKARILNPHPPTHRLATPRHFCLHRLPSSERRSFISPPPPAPPCLLHRTVALPTCVAPPLLHRCLTENVKGCFMMRSLASTITTITITTNIGHLAFPALLSCLIQACQGPLTRTAHAPQMLHSPPPPTHHVQVTRL